MAKVSRLVVSSFRWCLCEELENHSHRPHTKAPLSTSLSRRLILLSLSSDAPPRFVLASDPGWKLQVSHEGLHEELRVSTRLRQRNRKRAGNGRTSKQLQSKRKRPLSLRNVMVNSQASGVPSAPRSCAGCGGKIADRFLLFSMERYWHTRCLKCSCCQAQLGDIGTSCYSKGGMILCRSDYIRLFGHSGMCVACGQSIPANEMVMRAQGNVYHLKCFSCATCRNRLMPGDRFHYINGTIFCEHDRPGAALLNSHLPQLQSNSVLADQKVC
uniref:Si:dkey-90l8.3 n=1 Tax=Neogobius melanostomus TaxID=47308 RepID=A0A8C6TCP5_9GOBI